MKRFLDSEEAKRDYPNIQQRIAVAESMWKNRHKKENMSVWDRIEANLEE